VTVKVTYNQSAQKMTVFFDRPNVLMVEGKDEIGFVVEQLRIVGLDDVFQVHNMMGKQTDWSAAAEVIRDDAEFIRVGESIGVLRDADLAEDSALRSGARVVTIIAGRTPTRSGEIVVGESLRSGVMVLPGNGHAGALEHLAMEAGPRKGRLLAGQEVCEGSFCVSCVVA